MFANIREASSAIQSLALGLSYMDYIMVSTWLAKTWI